MCYFKKKTFTHCVCICVCNALHEPLNTGGTFFSNFVSAGQQLASYYRIKKNKQNRGTFPLNIISCANVCLQMHVKFFIVHFMQSYQSSIKKLRTYYEVLDSAYILKIQERKSYC